MPPPPTPYEAYLRIICLMMRFKHPASFNTTRKVLYLSNHLPIMRCKHPASLHMPMRKVLSGSQAIRQANLKAGFGVAAVGGKPASMLEPKEVAELIRKSPRPMEIVFRYATMSNIARVACSCQAPQQLLLVVQWAPLSA